MRLCAAWRMTRCYMLRFIKYKLMIMSKTKQDYLHELALIAFAMDEKAAKQEAKTKRLQRMAALARAGQKDSKEFKDLEMEFHHPTVTDYGDDMFALRKVVKQLRRYKIE